MSRFFLVLSDTFSRLSIYLKYQRFATLGTALSFKSVFDTMSLYMELGLSEIDLKAKLSEVYAEKFATLKNKNIPIFFNSNKENLRARLLDVLKNSDCLWLDILSVESSIVNFKNRQDSWEYAIWRIVAIQLLVCEYVGSGTRVLWSNLSKQCSHLAITEETEKKSTATIISSYKLIFALPIFSLIFAQFMGFEVFEYMFSSIFSFLCFIFGIILICVALIYTKKLLTKAREYNLLTGSIIQSFLIAADVLKIDREFLSILHTLVYTSAHELKEELNECELLINNSILKTENISLKLNEKIEILRYRDQLSHQIKLSELSSKLLLPLAIFALPGYIFLAVIPIIFSIITRM